MDPPELPVAQLVRLTGLFGISENRARVALSRMVASGEATSDGAGRYRLAGHLAARQVAPVGQPGRGDRAVRRGLVARRDHDDRQLGRGPGRPSRTLAYGRLAELREGVWMRPANVAVQLPDPLGGDVELMAARPADAVALAQRLWDLPAWSGRAPACWESCRRSPPTARGSGPGFELSAAVLRHLQADPLLPPSCCPPTGRAVCCGRPTTAGTPATGRR